MKTIEKTVPTVPVVLLASVLLETQSEAVTKDTLMQKSRDLIEHIESKEGRVLFPNKDKLVNLEAALEMLCLRRLVNREDGRYQLRENSLQVLEYYRNSIDHWLH